MGLTRAVALAGYRDIEHQVTEAQSLCLRAPAPGTKSPEQITLQLGGVFCSYKSPPVKTACEFKNPAIGCTQPGFSAMRPPIEEVTRQCKEPGAGLPEIQKQGPATSIQVACRKLRTALDVVNDIRSQIQTALNQRCEQLARTITDGIAVATAP